MKKILSVLLVCVLLVGTVFALASCAKTLSGTYSVGGDALGNTYKFSGSSVEITYKVLGFEKTVKATYEIKEVETEDEDDDKEYTITIKLNEGEDDGGQNLAGTFPFAEGEDDDGKYIWIGVIKYYKEK